MSLGISLGIVIAIWAIILCYIWKAPMTPFKKGFIEGLALEFIWKRFRK
jgi:hypothetical protein